MPDIALDWIFALLLLASSALGAWRGLVYEVLSLLNWIAAFILAQWLAPDVAQKIPMSGASELIRFAAAFVLVFVLIIFAGGLVARLVKKLLVKVGLGAPDRALGALFGLLRGVFLLLSATVVVSMTPIRNSDRWKESIGAGLTEAALQGLKPVLPHEFGKYLP